MSYDENNIAKVEVDYDASTEQVIYTVRIEYRIAVSPETAVNAEDFIAHSVVNHLKNFVNNLTEVELLKSKQATSIINHYKQWMEPWRSSL